MSQDQDMIPTKEGYKVEKCLGPSGSFSVKTIFSLN